MHPSAETEIKNIFFVHTQKTFDIYAHVPSFLIEHVPSQSLVHNSVCDMSRFMVCCGIWCVPYKGYKDKRSVSNLYHAWSANFCCKKMNSACILTD